MLRKGGLLPGAKWSFHLNMVVLAGRSSYYETNETEFVLFGFF